MLFSLNSELSSSVAFSVSKNGWAEFMFSSTEFASRFMSSSR